MKRISLLLMIVVVFITGCSGSDDFLNGEPTTTQPPAIPDINLSNDTIVSGNATETPDVELNPILLDLTFQNTGESDSFIIQYDKEFALIDCGTESAEDDIVSYLKRRGITEVKYLFITHPDSDHLGGCEGVLSNFTVTQVITNGQTDVTKSYYEVMSVIDTEQYTIGKRGDTFTIGPATLTIIQGNRDSPDSNLNSLVIRLDYGNISALYTGDCDRECEDELLLKGIDIDILKVAHHGSKYGTSEQFVFATSPSIAVISVGPNSYGHPSQEVIDRLESEGVELYRTDTQNYISILIDGKEYAVQKR